MTLHRRLHALCPILAVTLIWLIATAAPGQAGDRARIEAFLNVTGFDIALDSIAFSAGSAPQMLGLDANDFGADWERLSAAVFERKILHGLALDILEQTLSNEMLAHAAGFYASDLGQRLVEVENASHRIEDDSQRQAEGRRIVADLVAGGSGRLEVLKRMNAAIDSSGAGLRAIHEIQVRFLMAASAAGIIKMQIDEEGLRAVLKGREAETRLLLQQSALAGAAYTYQDIPEDDLQTYAEALEDPVMRRVYELLNAVQYEIMANRFEVLAARMAELHPGEEI